MLLSGIKSLDDALFSGAGIPPGSLLEIHGHSDSGKNSVALRFCKNVSEEADKYVAWVSAEANITIKHLKWAGINTTNFFVARQHPALPGLELARELVLSGCSLVVVDSVSALIDETSELPLASVVGKGLLPLKVALQQTGAIGILLNQDRSLVPGKSLTHSGSCPALVKLVDCRIRLSRGAGIYRGHSLEGMRVHFSLAKNGPDIKDWGREGRFSCYWKTGLKDVKGYKPRELVDVDGSYYKV